VAVGYDVILGRQPDPDGIKTYESAHGRVAANRELVQVLCSSPEFDRHQAFSARTFGNSIHAGRCHFILALPRARQIVGLGGTNLGDARGALVRARLPI
jgi:hypothetical protein